MRLSGRHVPARPPPACGGGGSGAGAWPGADPGGLAHTVRLARLGLRAEREARWWALLERQGSRRASGQKWGGAGAGFELPPFGAWGYFQALALKG